MVVEIGKSGRSKKVKMDSIRRMLYKYGDIPRGEVNKATSLGTARQWVAVFGTSGNVLSAGRVVKSDWYSFTVKNLFTVKGARGQGLGSSVVKKLVMLATKRGAKVIVADITSTNVPSKKICLKLGFKVVSTFKWAKGKKPADILHFVLYPPTKRKAGVKKKSSSVRKKQGLGIGGGFGSIKSYGLSSKIRLDKTKFKF